MIQTISTRCCPLPFSHRRQDPLFRALIPLAALFVAFALSTGCSNSDAERSDRKDEKVLESSTVVYTLRPYKEPCQTEPRDFCLIADQADQTARRLYTPIDGLQFKWGVVQTVEVKADRIEDTPGGQQRYRYTLLRLISEAPVLQGMDFDITVDQNDIAPNDDCRFSIPDELVFTVADRPLCEKLNESLRAGTATRPLFTFTADQSQPIILKDVLSPIVPAGEADTNL